MDSAVIDDGGIMHALNPIELSFDILGKDLEPFRGDDHIFFPAP